MLYLDHAATSPTRPEVREQLLADLSQPLNASSVHQQGQRAQALLERARAEIADLIGLQASEVIFTSSATEANNLALRGFVQALRGRGKTTPTVATSMLEHACIRETCRDLERRGDISLQNLKIQEDGRVALPDQMEADLFTLPTVQNETGVVQDLGKARQLRMHGTSRWLCDITQGVAIMKTNIRDLGADFVSFASHKIGGPPGIALLAGPGLRDLVPMITGGPQEGELRGGTQPVALARGFALALKLALSEREDTVRHLKDLERVFLGVLDERGINYQRNGGAGQIAPGFLNLSIPGFSGPDLVIALDGCGIAVSSGSACSTGVMETSEALASMYPHDPERASGALRITPWREITMDDMRFAAQTLADLVLRDG